MKTVTHTLTAFDGVYEKTIYNVGPAKVVINTDDFYTDTNTRYYKLHTQVDTGKITVYTLDLGADNSSLSGRQIETNVYPSSAYHTTRTELSDITQKTFSQCEQREENLQCYY